MAKVLKMMTGSRDKVRPGVLCHKRERSDGSSSNSADGTVDSESCSPVRYTGCTNVNSKEEEFETGESESLMGMIPDEVLLYMMRDVWPSEMLFGAMGVCRRWNRVGNAASKAFICKTKSIVHGLCVDRSHLTRIASEFKRIRVSLPVATLMCQRTRDREVLKTYLPVDTMTRRQWMNCLHSAIGRDNVQAIETLSAAMDRHDPVSPEETSDLVHRACQRLKGDSLRAVCKYFPNTARAAIADRNLVHECCRSGRTMALLELLNHDEFRTVYNIQALIHHALRRDIEPLVYKIFLTVPMDPDAHAIPALQKSCMLNWLTTAQIIVRKYGIDLARRTQPFLRLAISRGNEDMVRFLLSHDEVDPGYDFNLPVREAIRTGNADIVAMLLDDRRVDVTNTTSVDNSLLCTAAAKPMLDPRIAVQLLMMGTDPNQYKHAAIRIAMQTSNTAFILVLASHPAIELTGLERLSVLSMLDEDRSSDRELIQKLVRSKFPEL